MGRGATLVLLPSPVTLPEPCDQNCSGFAQLIIMHLWLGAESVSVQNNAFATLVLVTVDNKAKFCHKALWKIVPFRTRTNVCKNFKDFVSLRI